MNRLAAYAALQAIPDGGLFFEDDVDVEPDWFWEAAQILRDARAVGTFFVPRRASLHPVGVMNEVLDGRPVRRCVAPLRNTRERRGFYGTQAMYFPKDFVRLALSSRLAFMTGDGLPLEGSHGFDFFVKEQADKILGVFPNPVQHRNPPKMTRVSRGETSAPGAAHTSLTFGMRHA
jgi:hypothetical protein